MIVVKEGDVDIGPLIGTPPANPVSYDAQVPIRPPRNRKRLWRRAPRKSTTWLTPSDFRVLPSTRSLS